MPYKKKWVIVRGHESSEPRHVKCNVYFAFGRTWVKRSALPKLLVDLPRPLDINGKKTDVFEVFHNERAGAFYLSN